MQRIRTWIISITEPEDKTVGWIDSLITDEKLDWEFKLWQDGGWKVLKTAEGITADDAREIASELDATLKEELEEEIAQKYTKPASGIPKTDLTEGVQSALDKADSAVLFNEQLLTLEQKEQARKNIDALGGKFAYWDDTTNKDYLDICFLDNALDGLYAFDMAVAYSPGGVGRLTLGIDNVLLWTGLKSDYEELFLSAQVYEDEDNKIHYIFHIDSSNFYALFSVHPLSNESVSASLRDDTTGLTLIDTCTVNFTETENNKTSDIANNASSTSKYPNCKAVADYVEDTAVCSTSIRTMVTLSQADYDALVDKDANTLYVIV